MYKRHTIQMQPTSIEINESYVGETLEEKIFRITNNKEPIKDGAPLIYTDRKDGVQPDYDIRTDSKEIAAIAMDKLANSELTKRSRRIAGKKVEKDPKTEQKDPKTEQKKDGKPEPTQGDSKA